MTVFSALRSATVLTAAALIGAPAAFGIDPGRAPRNTEPIVPNYQDPYGAVSATPNSPFDPFAPQNGVVTPAATTTPNQPYTGTNVQRITPNLVPPTTPIEPSRWKIGMYSTNTGTGVQIVKVGDNTPAQAAGLEEDDTIVNVSGYQVGYVHNHLHDIGQAFNEYADPDGYVVLLVHNKRDGSLVNLPVQLQSRFQRIQGTIGFQAINRMPANAQARIALHEVVPGRIDVPIAQTTVTDLRQSPVSFSLDVDPSLIDPRRQYVVNADITAANNTLYTTRQEYRVLTAGYPKTVDMRLYPTTTANNNYNGYADNRQQQLDQIRQWYQEYLHRDPRINERAAWQSSIDRGVPLSDVRADLLALPEFYNQANQDDRQYIENMYLAVLGRRPQQEEIDAWISQLNARQGLRREIAREFLAQVSKQQ